MSPQIAALHAVVSIETGMRIAHAYLCFNAPSWRKNPVIAVAYTDCPFIALKAFISKFWINAERKVDIAGIKTSIGSALRRDDKTNNGIPAAHANGATCGLL